jgi:hypothetical protein
MTTGFSQPSTEQKGFATSAALLSCGAMPFAGLGCCGEPTRAVRQAKKKPQAGDRGPQSWGFLLGDVTASPHRELACPVPPRRDTSGDLLGYLGPEVISFTDGKVGKTSEPSHVISQ